MYLSYDKAPGTWKNSGKERRHEWRQPLSSPTKTYQPDLYKRPSAAASTSIDDQFVRKELLAWLLCLPVVKISKEMIHFLFYLYFSGTFHMSVITPSLSVNGPRLVKLLNLPLPCFIYYAAATDCFTQSAADPFLSNDTNRHEWTIPTHLEVVSHFLKDYDTDAVIAEADEETWRFKQGSLTPWDFFLKLLDLTLLYSGVYNELMLRKLFFKNIELSIRSTMRRRWADDEEATPWDLAYERSLQWTYKQDAGKSARRRFIRPRLSDAGSKPPKRKESHASSWRSKSVPYNLWQARTTFRQHGPGPRWQAKSLRRLYARSMSRSSFSRTTALIGEDAAATTTRPRSPPVSRKTPTWRGSKPELRAPIRFGGGPS